MSDDEILSQFLEEGFEHISKFELSLLDLEKDTKNLLIVQALYRNMHTIKGAASFFTFKNLETLVHTTESLFAILQKQEEEQRASIIEENKLVNLFFKVNDAVKQSLNYIRIHRTDTLDNQEIILKELNIIREKIETALSAKPKRKLNPMQEKALAALKKTSDNSSVAPKVEELKLDDNIIVKLNTIEILSSLSSELILARNQLGAMLELKDDSGYLRANYYKINQLTQRISDRVMKIRLQPISVVTDKLRRVVRDLASSCSKEVDLIIEGEQIEVDRTILEAIRDPMIHLLRNSIDHGLEDPGRREELGKSRVGTIKIKASYQENHVVLIVSDDGSGIDLNKIKEKALLSHLITSEEAESLNEEALLTLIFKPGFSTRDTVSELSGRGIGMDIVKTCINQVNGSIAVETKLGLGTDFIIKLPLSLATGTLAIIEVAGLHYGISDSYIKEFGSIQFSKIIDQDSIEIRDQKYPIIFAKQLLGYSPKDYIRAYSRQEVIEYLIIKTSSKQFILIVDAINDLQDAVIKPLPMYSRNLSLYSGATILSDGQVALILDPDKFTKVSVMPFETQSKLVESASDQPLKKIVTFNLGDFQFGLDKEMVAEIVAFKPITPIPGSEIEGLLNLRDNIVLNKRLTKILGINSNKKTFAINILIKANGRLLSLQVDDIQKIVELEEDHELCLNPDSQLLPYANGVYMLDDKPLYLLNQKVYL